MHLFHIPECSIQNTFLFWMEHRGIWNRCIVGVVKLVCCVACRWDVYIWSSSVDVDQMTFVGMTFIVCVSIIFVTTCTKLQIKRVVVFEELAVKVPATAALPVHTDCFATPTECLVGCHQTVSRLRGKSDRDKKKKKKNHGHVTMTTRMIDLTTQYYTT